MSVDVIVAQGYDGGGHTGRVGTFTLVPAVVDCVEQPVLAAGGLADGRGLVAAIAMGATSGCGRFDSLIPFPEIVLTKNEYFYIFRDMSNHEEKKIEEFAEMFKALSNPNRLKIFLRLISCCQPGTIWNLQNGSESEGCACVGDLSQDLNIVPSTISHHIKELRHAGLIRMKRKGQRVECSIDPEAIAALKGFFMRGK